MRSAVVAADFAAREPSLEGLAVLVVGLGRSGLAASRLALSRGAIVTAVDLRGEAELDPGVEEIRALGATIRAGGHPPELADGADLVVVSPGVPSHTAVLAAARSRGVPVWGEVELAFRYCRGRILGITGSNGKSTTTSMAGTILRAAGFPGGTGGNLGTPLAELLTTDSPSAVHAVELSSFQLETIERFSPAVAVVLNLSPDHLDRYPTYEAYARTKARLLEVQDAEAYTVLNADDPETVRLEPFVRGRLHLFSTRSEPETGAFVRQGRLVLRIEGDEEEVLPTTDLPVPGEHNVANALAAALACRLVGCEVGALARGLRSYRALPHRLQLIAIVDDVRFYNDSKATNLDATVRALQSFPSKQVHLILGGKDKGADWRSLAPVVRERARRVLLVGQAAEAVRAGLRGAVQLVDCGTVREAVRVGFDGASPGDLVLLAPGCASFDQYRSFEERGEDFRRAVEALLPGESHDA